MMSMKRFFGAVTAAAMALGSVCCPVFAGEKSVVLSVADPAGDIVRFDVTNEAMDGKQVSFYLFKPGKGIEDLKADGSDSAKNALYQTLVFDFEGENISLDVKMKAPEGDNHTYKYLVIAQNGEQMSGEFEYYTNGEKEALIDEINAAKTGTEKPLNLADRIYRHFSVELESFKLFSSVKDMEKVGELVLELSKETEVTLDNVTEFFEEAVVIAAFCEGAPGLFENNEFAYMDFINPENDYLKYYNENLNADGIKNCISNIYDKSYKSIAEIKAKMEKQVVVNAVINNKLKGYGHIEMVIKNFEKDFTDAGLNITKYNESNKNTVGSKFMENTENLSKNNLNDIASAINKIVNDLASGSGSTGGGSGGSSGGGSGSKNNSKGQVIAPPVVNTEEKEITKEVIFSDLNGFDWAKESIESLFKKGVISGKEEGKFAPADNITREEFTVLLVKAFNLKDSATSASFDDVKSSRWSYEFIASAYGAGIISGDGKNFRPDENITRQDIASILLRTLMNKNIIADVKPAEGIFDDESEISAYALESVQIMNELGVVNGDGTGCFKPKNNATRAESAVIIQRALELL